MHTYIRYSALIAALTMFGVSLVTVTNQSEDYQPRPMASISLDQPDDTRFMAALSSDVARARVESYRAERARLAEEARKAAQVAQQQPTTKQPVPKQVEPKQPVIKQKHVETKQKSAAKQPAQPKPKKQKPAAAKQAAPKVTVINTAAYGDQAEIDSCIGAVNVTVSSRYYGVPYLAQHTSCGGGRILALSQGDPVIVDGVSYAVAGSRTQAWTPDAVNETPRGYDAYLQACLPNSTTARILMLKRA